MKNQTKLIIGLIAAAVVGVILYKKFKPCGCAGHKNGTPTTDKNTVNFKGEGYPTDHYKCCDSNGQNCSYCGQGKTCGATEKRVKCYSWN